MVSVMLVGETWMTHSVHHKGFDTFVTSEYVTAGEEFFAALRGAGHSVLRVAAHEVGTEFPEAVEGLSDVEVLVLSDVGANTFLLGPRTFNRSELAPNKLLVIREFVARGGGLLMVGGYMSFSGIEGKARYGLSPLADVLPVEVGPGDDRVERPEGVAPVCSADHFVSVGLEGSWPPLLGWNRVRTRSKGCVLAFCDDDPLLVVGAFGAGRVAAFASDLAPHWAPPGFLGWPGYSRLWDQLVTWLAGDGEST